MSHISIASLSRAKKKAQELHKEITRLSKENHELGIKVLYLIDELSFALKFATKHED